MPKKNISILLKSDIKHLGKMGSLVSVKAGYARNYLFPKNLAVMVTPSIQKQANKILEIQQQKQQETEIQAKNLQHILEKLKVLILKKKIGKGDAIFGTVTEREIVQLLNQITGYDLEKKQIELPEIKAIGQYTINVKLNTNLIVSLDLHILPIWILH